MPAPGIESTWLIKISNTATHVISRDTCPVGIPRVQGLQTEDEKTCTISTIVFLLSSKLKKKDKNHLFNYV